MNKYLKKNMVFLFTLLFTAAASNLTLPQDRTPREVVRSIIDRVISETEFEYDLVPQTEVLGIQILDFYKEFGDTGGDFYALSFMQSDNDTVAELGVSASPKISIWLNEKALGFKSSSSPSMDEIAYGMVNFYDTLRVKINKGFNKILIKSSGANSKVLLKQITSDPEANRWINFTSEPLSDKSGTASWLFTGPFSSQLESVPEKQIKKFYKNSGKYLSWSVPKTRMIKELKVGTDNVFKRDSYADWNYANGATHLGILGFAELTNDKNYFDFIKKWCDNIINNIEYFRWQYNSLHAMRGSYHRIFRKSMLDDAGAPVLPFAQYYLKEKNDNYLKIISEMNSYVMKDQMRLPNGTFSRPEPVLMTVWSDDLFMSVPLLLRMAKIFDDSKYYDEVGRQIINFTKLLFNENEKLFKHGWFSEKKETSVAFWGRANGWVMWAISEALMKMPKNHSDYNSIMKIYISHLEGLLKHQGKSGMWHQVIDHYDSYEESSCTAMFIIGLTRGVNNGWIDHSYSEYAVKAWDALTKKIEPDGIVHGICRGTGIGYDLEFYFNRPTFDNDPRGLGAVITAGTEISKLLDEKK
jgi:unsaturated rhamnogalacturonyl hydrolase